MLSPGFAIPLTEKDLLLTLGYYHLPVQLQEGQEGEGIFYV
jgi:hypothetical protein